MPVQRTFRGKPVKRTHRTGDKILVIYEGNPGKQEQVNFSEYQSQAKVVYKPRR